MFQTVFGILLISTLINSEVVQFEKCRETSDSICEIKEVRINPCKEAEEQKPCRLKIATNATIEFDYVPHFNATKYLNQVYAVSRVDIPLVGYNRDGCKVTSCAGLENEQAVYKTTIFMARYFPPLQYNVKLKLWNSENATENCCVMTQIKLFRFGN